MAIVQVSVTMENNPGVLSAISEMMGEAGANLLALMVATATGEGLLRFVTDDTEKAVQALESNGYKPETREVLACQTPHHPGGLNAILKPLKEADINVDHVYPCIGTSAGGQTVLILGVSSPAKARQILKRNWIIMVDDELYEL